MAEMLLVDSEEWKTLQILKLHLIQALQHGVLGPETREFLPPALARYEHLRKDLERRVRRVNSTSANSNIGRWAISRIKEACIELLGFFKPVLQRIWSSDPSILHIQRILSQPTSGGENGNNQTEAISTSARALSSNKTTLLLPSPTLFRTHQDCKLQAPLGDEGYEERLAAINPIAAIFDSLGWHLALSCSKEKPLHQIFFQGTGLGWRAENNKSFSWFLSSCGDSAGWQEIECFYDERRFLRAEHEKGTFTPLQSLCGDLTFPQNYNDVISLHLFKGTLYADLKKDIHSQKRFNVKTETLEALFETRRFHAGKSPTGFSTLAKREISLNLAWSFLYLFDCSWAHQDWSADKILILSSKSTDSGPLEFEPIPYIHCQVGYVSSQEENIDWVTTSHNFKFLALSQLLLEMDLGEKITATVCNDFGQPDLWLTILKLTGERERSYYTKAIESCLAIYSRIRMTPIKKGAEIAKGIYKQIIENLEKDFEAVKCGTSKKEPRQRVSPHPMDGVYDSLKRSYHTSERARVGTRGSSKETRRATKYNQREQIRRTTDPHTASPSFVQSNGELGRDIVKEGYRAVSMSRAFMKNMRSFLENNLLPDFSTPSQRIKVCVIDTGVDIQHPTLLAAKAGGRLKEIKSFKEDPDDKHGHGTNIAELILELAPEVALYVAKVSVRKEMPQEDTALITKAIQWAMKHDVDIISLSLSLELPDDGLDKAINDATAAGKIVFSAAGNDGANKERGYPGRKRNVLCIHASNGKGKDGGISPPALNNDDNFMTLGMDIPLQWKGNEVIKTGTSFATPVAAAIAANVLAIIPRQVSLTESQRAHLFSSDGMRKIFDQLLGTPSDNGYKYVAPWKLWGGGKSQEHIGGLILDTLKR